MKKRLGKGLDALFDDRVQNFDESIDDIQATNDERIEEIEIDKILTSNEQPRKILMIMKLKSLLSRLKMWDSFNLLL